MVVLAQTNTDIETKREMAQGYISQLKNLIYQQGLSVLEIGRLLLIFRNEKLYEHLGHENFNQFISDSDIGIAPSTANNICRIYQVFVLKLKYQEDKLSEISWGRLQMLVTIVDKESEENVKEWIEKARTLGSGDFGDEVTEYKKNKGQEKKLAYPRVRRCRDCKLWRIEPVEGTVCKCIDQSYK